jgi:soluble lytic murein transglycosylase-like protein
MKNLRGTYVHRGDAPRRRARVKQTVFAVGFFAASAFVVGNRRPAAPEAQAAPVRHTATAAGIRIDLSTDRSLVSQLDSVKGELELARAQLDRATKVIGFSSRYRIGADLASTITDVASAEGIDPELAFRLVKLESDFNPRAVSRVGAVGLTQVMPATAQYYVKGITRDGLYEPSTNLRVGFRYLRGLVKEYHGDVNLALLVYNRGPVAVEKARAGGDNPSNGYDRILTRGYRGTGTVQ